MTVKKLIDKNIDFTETEFADFIGSEFNQLVDQCEYKIEEAFAYVEGLCNKVNKNFIRELALYCTRYARGAILEPTFAFKLAMTVAVRESMSDNIVYTPEDIVCDVVRFTDEYNRTHFPDDTFEG